ncbi:hypothetical protein LFM09_46315 [Lentzea alba]|uniref:hypothetical protein n=1 Tax=Lentzea alba TaxID=2714351 RepID=UPI0039BF29D1
MLIAESPDMRLAELLDELKDPATGITRVTVGGEPSLGTVFDAGYRRLSRLGQRCYRAMGLHLYVDDLPVAVLAAAMGIPEAELRPVVRELRDTRTIDQPRASRLTVHKLVHEHARLVADTVDDAVHRLAATRSMIGWCTTGAVTAVTGLLPPRSWRADFLPESVVDAAHPASVDPGAWLRAERVNLRAVVTVAFELGGLEPVLRLCISQWWLFLAEKYADDLLATHALGLRAADHLHDDRMKALLLVQQGFAYRSLGRFCDAVDSCTAAMRLAEAVGSVELVATRLEGAGLAAFDGGDLTQAALWLRRNLELAETTCDPRRIALACLHGAKPEPSEQALVLLERAYEVFRSLPVPESQNLAKVLLWQGRKLGAEGGPRLREALALATEHRHQADRAEILEALAQLDADRDVAVELYREALTILDDVAEDIEHLGLDVVSEIEEPA